MWIPYVDWSPRTKSMFPNKSKVQRVEKVEKSAKPENDLNKRRHRRVSPTTFSAILFDALKQGDSNDKHLWSSQNVINGIL